jgi:protein phosphatase
MSSNPDTTADHTLDQDFAARFFVTSNAPVTVRFGGATHIGLVRRNNEDHFAVIRRNRSQDLLLSNLPPEAFSPSGDATYWFIVADGLGGAPAGEWASRLALQTAWDLAEQASTWVMKFHDLVAQRIQERTEAFASEMHRTLLEYGQDRELNGMGTTWTSASVIGWDALIAHVGDSRAYHFRRGDLQQVTRDQTVAQELIDRGVPVEQTLQMRNALTNMLGGRHDTVSPDVSHLALEDGDRMLLCTDGLTNPVSDLEIAEVLGRPLPTQAACDALIELALGHGGRDNVTVVVAEFSGQSSSEPTK